MHVLPWIPEQAPPDAFPHPSTALQQPNGLLAAGGDLSAERLLAAYRAGIFPWYSDEEPILWWSPDPRAVIVPASFHQSRSLRRQIRGGDYIATLDTAFGEVVDRCAAPRDDQNGTWITVEMKQAYARLHELGHAHSIEIWQAGEIIGGLYGVCCGRAFFGESMFSRGPSGSKIALAALCEQLNRWQFLLLDCQVESAHLTTLGAQPWPRAKFMRALSRAVAPQPWLIGRWRIDKDLNALSHWFSSTTRHA